ncbi:hypothetical protein C6P46_000446 [Rhodotorula mucilaginosa]|uniref:Transmembrane protein n=1 Tax=Rhodotorula mucilaginosa TaxID=5537 RepID=A0A9P7B3D2_RHOMI|nr:hypothetical protein C6P46_000446 [Rhodotorula mucilaginosa]
MRRPAQLLSHLAARSPYWTLVLLLQYLHLALGRPAPPSEEEDAPAANDDGAGGVAAKEEQKPTATAAPSTAKNEAEKSSSTETATAAWATQTSGGMQQSSDKQDTIILHSDASLSKFWVADISRADGASGLQAGPIWETLKWEACCQKFTFPDGVATTVGASASTGTTNANGLLTGLDGSTFSFIIAAIAAVVIAAAALIAVMCCKPRKTNPSVNLQHILSGDGKEAALARPPPAAFSTA